MHLAASLAFSKASPALLSPMGPYWAFHWPAWPPGSCRERPLCRPKSAFERAFRDLRVRFMPSSNGRPCLIGNVQADRGKRIGAPRGLFDIVEAHHLQRAGECRHPRSCAAPVQKPSARRSVDRTGRRSVLPVDRRLCKASAGGLAPMHGLPVACQVARRYGPPLRQQATKAPRPA